VKRILIIDDEKDFCYVVKNNLRLTGKYKAIVASGSNMGAWFASCRWHKPDMILLDIMMPGKDGFELLGMLKKDEQTAQIPVIMVTAKGEEESRKKAKSLGCDDYIVKPIDIDTLIERMEKVMSEKGGEK